MSVIEAKTASVTIDQAGLERQIQQGGFSVSMTLSELASYLRTVRGVARIYFKNDGCIYLCSFRDRSWMVRIETPKNSADHTMSIHVDNLQFKSSRFIHAVYVSGQYGDSFDDVESETMTVMTKDKNGPINGSDEDDIVSKYSIRIKNRSFRATMSTEAGGHRALFRLTAIGNGVTVDCRDSDTARMNLFPKLDEHSQYGDSFGSDFAASVRDISFR